MRRISLRQIRAGDRRALCMIAIIMTHHGNMSGYGRPEPAAATTSTIALNQRDTALDVND
jgi:hypothetical protein